MLNTDDCYPPVLIYPFEEGKRVLFLVVSFPPGGLPPLGCLLAWTLVLASCFLFLSLSWGLSFYKVWQGFIISGRLQKEVPNSTTEYGFSWGIGNSRLG
jgi:hypothetical protein